MTTKTVNKRTHIPTSNDFYIGRPSIYGNPWSHLGNGAIKVSNRAEAIQNYKDWLNGSRFTDFKPEQRTKILDQIEELRDKTLVCWCKPSDCHGDILIEILNENKQS